MRMAVFVPFESDESYEIDDLLAIRCYFSAGEANILIDGFPWEQARSLKNHRYKHIGFFDGSGYFCFRDKSVRYGIQKCCFSAAGWSEYRYFLAAIYPQRNILKHERVVSIADRKMTDLEHRILVESIAADK